MIKAKINITINLLDEFELGSCKGCPYHLTSEYESSYHSYTRTEKCLLKFDKVTCPIELVEPRNDYCSNFTEEDKRNETLAH